MADEKEPKENASVEEVKKTENKNKSEKKPENNGKDCVNALEHLLK